MTCAKLEIREREACLWKRMRISVKERVGKRGEMRLPNPHVVVVFFITNVKTEP